MRYGSIPLRVPGTRQHARWARLLDWRTQFAGAGFSQQICGILQRFV
jgi:hypothetical protein